jgi:O-acetyl-ADP-ribose deacetylase (regulator of RNase III)
VSQDGRKTCFVIMPFGDKINIAGETIDAIRESVATAQPIAAKYIQPIEFDRIYTGIIEKAAVQLDLDCTRCDQIKGAGSIHEDMFRHIWEADVAIVDISTLNANVFYELGMRHTLHKKVTVLIQRKGTTAPFNIHGYRVITYDETNEAGADAAIEEIAAFVREGLRGEDGDSPVYKHLPLLRATVGAAPPERRIIESTEFYEYTVDALPRATVGFVTGDIGKIRDIDVWVNSENLNMQMARFHDASISGAIRWLGARKNPYTQRVIEDTIALELAGALEGCTEVDAGAVIPTGSGALLASHGVKRIFHAAAVIGQPRRGYRPIPDIGACVTNSLELMDREGEVYSLDTIVFPLMGTGVGGSSITEAVKALVTCVLAYLRKNPATRIKRIYFLAPIPEILLEGMAIFNATRGLSPVQTVRRS